jgi:hypothetical protein
MYLQKVKIKKKKKNEPVFINLKKFKVKLLLF